MNYQNIIEKLTEFCTKYSIWAPSARLDLKDIASYIAEAGPKSSIRFSLAGSYYSHNTINCIN